VTDRVWAVIVARVGNGAKSRLAGALSQSQRRTLALAMLGDVVSVCVEARDVLAGTLAVVDRAARYVVLRSGGLILDDPGDMNAAAALGVRAAVQRGATSVVVLPGDVPSITTRDLMLLAAAAGPAERAVIIAASRDGDGTNALLLRPPDVIAPAFGPPSVDRHLQAGLSAGALTRVVTGLGLAKDIDTPTDLDALADAPVGPRTAATLAALLPIRHPHPSPLPEGEGVGFYSQL
jgi:2-phospho-L-lactate/phosphoenolpyruvate guanylyltransferase